jgi:HD superfamily phosphohydrolase
VSNKPARQNQPEAFIRDALYDRIPLHARERHLISSPPFLRLDRIQQLGFVSRVWPGAKHTRYEHSLGVLHLTRLAIDRLRNRYETPPFSENDADTIIAAALVHDIGHYPFSHAIEELGPPVLSHEAIGRTIITSDPIASILERDWGVSPGRVADLVDGRTDDASDADRLLYGLLSGTLDMDKLDYLPRDAHACSVPYGGVDSERLLDALVVTEVPDPHRPHRLGITEKGISPLHSLINARQEMFDNVYWHHTNRACMIMLLRAVQEAMLAGTIAPRDLTDHDDASFLAKMQEPAMPAATRRLGEALANRRIHKRAVEVSARATELYNRLSALWYDPARRRETELRLSAGLATHTGQPVPDTAILIDIPKPERWKTDVWVAFDRPPVGFRPVMHWRDVVGMADEDFKRYEEHRRMIRIVTDEPYREALTEHWEELLFPALGGVV